MQKHTIVGMLIGAALVGGAALPLLASAQTLSADQLRTQINSLLQQITTLRAQMTSSASSTMMGSSTSAAAQTIGTAVRNRICAALSRSLSIGMQGDDVRSLQEFLRERGHLSAEATGYFGSLTAAGVAQWQSSQNLSPVGIFGPRSRERMMQWCGATPAPAATLSAIPTSGQAPLTVAFRANVSLMNPQLVADAGSYKITFGDGSEQVFSCTGSVSQCVGPQTTQHTYTANGTYTASLVHFGFFGAPGPDGTIRNTATVGTVTINVGPIACTMEYAPACGLKPIVCITTPCNPVPTTYSNSCMMRADGATLSYQGECRANAPQNAPPVISSISGPTALAVNTAGTWSIQASDPENGPLTYSVEWGDEWYVGLTAADFAYPGVPISQTSTFMHTYSHSGTFTVKVVVRDNGGKEAKASVTVQVGNGSVVCSTDYNPVCGQPPEPACRSAVPACMIATPGPQTYSNSCMMNVAGATLLYSGQCTTTSSTTQ